MVPCLSTALWTPSPFHSVPTPCRPSKNALNLSNHWTSPTGHFDLAVSSPAVLLWLSDWRLLLCDVGCGWWNGLHQLCLPTAGRRKFKSWSCWGPWVSLSCTSPGSSLLYIYWVGEIWTCHKEQNIPCGLEELKAGFFRIAFVCGVFICTLPLQGFKAFFCVSFQPVPVDPWGETSLLHVISFASHTFLSLACRTGFGERELLLTACRCGLYLGGSENQPRTRWGWGRGGVVCLYTQVGET